MNIEIIETVIRWLGGVLAYITLGALLFGIWRGTQREAGLSIGRNVAWLRSPWFYLVTSAIFFGTCYLGWIRLPLTVPSPTRLDAGARIAGVLSWDGVSIMGAAGVG